MQDGRGVIIDAHEGFKVTKASADEIIDMIKDIRPVDKAETEKLTGLSFNIAVLDIIVTYDFPLRKLTYKGIPLGFGGWDDRGVVWIVLTNEYNNHKIAFLKWGKRYLKNFLLKKFKSINNVVWKKNVDHVRFLKFFVATFTDIGHDLLLFTITRGE